MCNVVRRLDLSCIWVALFDLLDSLCAVVHVPTNLVKSAVAAWSGDVGVAGAPRAH